MSAEYPPPPTEQPRVPEQPPAPPEQPPPVRRTATPPPLAAPPTSTRGDLDLRVTEHVLWVGHAAYPIRNIARIFTFVLRPRYALAAFTFFRRTGLTLAALVVLTIVDSLATSPDLNSSGDGTDQSSLSGWLVFLWVIGVVAIIAWAAQLVQVLAEKPHPALAIETSGPSTALVTLPQRQDLDRLVDALVGAIENPGHEVIYQVDRLDISSPSNYYFGDVVNMYGGNGHMGMMKS